MADRLRELRDAGLIEEGYTATARGRQLEPVIHALTRVGLTWLRPLRGAAIVYRPSFAAYALRALADAAPPSDDTVVFLTHVESESFFTRQDDRGAATWIGEPAGPDPQIVSTDTIAALALATGTWTVREARRHGRLSLTRSPDDGRRWAQAHGLRR